MKFNYTKSGSMVLTADTLEDRIILCQIHGVKEGMDGVITFRADINNQFVATPPIERSAATGFLSASEVTEVMNLLRAKQKLAAVKLVKEVTGLGLKESKELVDNWETR